MRDASKNFFFICLTFEIKHVKLFDGWVIKAFLGQNKGRCENKRKRNLKYGSYLFWPQMDREVYGSALGTYDKLVYHIMSTMDYYNMINWIPTH